MAVNERCIAIDHFVIRARCLPWILRRFVAIAKRVMGVVAVVCYGNWKSSFPDHGIRNVMRCPTDFFFFFSFSKFHVSWHSRCELFLIGLDRFGTLEIREEMEKLEWDQKMKDSRILALNRIAEIFNETSDLIILFQEQNIYHIYKTRRWRYIERINELIESKFVTIIYNCISEYISTTRDKRKEKMWFIKCILLSFNSIKNRTNHKSISIIINKIGISNIVGCKILMDQR